MTTRGPEKGRVKSRKAGPWAGVGGLSGVSGVERGVGRQTSAHGAGRGACSVQAIKMMQTKIWKLKFRVCV